MNSVIFIGYDVRITYDDYDTHEVLVQELKEIEEICKTLENGDDNFIIEYKMKYKLEDETFLFTKKESYTIDNPTIPKRELSIRKFNKIAKIIYHSTDVKDENLQECADILEDILSTTHSMNDRKIFIDEIVKVYKKFNMSLAHEDTQGAFKIEKYSHENIDWLKETLLFGNKNEK